MKFSNYQEAREYLEGFIKPVVFERITEKQAKIQDPLLRMRYLLSLLGNPQNKFKSILVGGTAGKGSTAYLISHILKTAGYKTGLTISPHLEKINERMQINGEQISDQKLIKMVGSIVQTIKLMEKSKFGEPSYFEILVALAFIYFVEEKVEIAVVEVGLGGRYDATNTLNPLISVLTNVSLDHTQILGKTVEQIAREKVGIIKERRKTQNKTQKEAESIFSVVPRTVQRSSALAVITGVKQPSVVKIVEDKCKEAEVELYRLSQDFSFRIKKESLDGTVFDLTTTRDRVKKLNGLRLSLLGQYQVENASLAIEAVLQLEKFGFDVDEQHIRQALKTAFFPGRFEIINFQLSTFNSQLVLDGAHNPTKMKAFIKTLKKLYPKNRKIFVVAFKKDKDIKGMLKQILSIADSIIVTEFHVTTDVSKNATMRAEKIAEEIKRLRDYGIKKIFIEKDSSEAVSKALNISPIIIVTGSLYFVGEIRSLFFNPHTGSGSFQKARQSRLSPPPRRR